MLVTVSFLISMHPYKLFPFNVGLVLPPLIPSTISNTAVYNLRYIRCLRVCVLSVTVYDIYRYDNVLYWPQASQLLEKQNENSSLFSAQVIRSSFQWDGVGSLCVCTKGMCVIYFACINWNGAPISSQHESGCASKQESYWLCINIAKTTWSPITCMHHLHMLSTEDNRFISLTLTLPYLIKSNKQAFLLAHARSIFDDVINHIHILGAIYCTQE